MKPSQNRGRRKPKPVTQADRKEAFLREFEKLWTMLFSSTVHLDAALSKSSKFWKSNLAETVQPILLRPASLAEAMGIGVPRGQPWNLNTKEIARWRPALLMAERLFDSSLENLERLAESPEDFPKDFISEWEAAWGKETSAKLMRALVTRPPMSLRIARQVDRKKILQELSEREGASDAALSALSPRGIRVPSYAPVMDLESFKSGAFEIQDEGSQLMALIALWPEIYGAALRPSPEPGAGEWKAPELPQSVSPLEVVDACAGAGGKSLALADALKGRGRVYAYDTVAGKLTALRKRATRARLNNIQPICVEEGKEALVVSKHTRSANVVLVDAPCSGWGVLRRNPDIKWRKERDALERMPKIQTRLLDVYSELVAEGGRLVYGVCTFRVAETRDVVTRFLETHPDFKAGVGGFLGPGPSDGFFVQVFERKK